MTLSNTHNFLQWLTNLLYFWLHTLIFRDAFDTPLTPFPNRIFAAHPSSYSWPHLDPTMTSIISELSRVTSSTVKILLKGGYWPNFHHITKHLYASPDFIGVWTLQSSPHPTVSKASNTNIPWYIAQRELMCCGGDRTRSMNDYNLCLFSFRRSIYSAWKTRAGWPAALDGQLLEPACHWLLLGFSLLACPWRLMMRTAHPWCRWRQFPSLASVWRASQPDS